MNKNPDSGIFWAPGTSPTPRPNHRAPLYPLSTNISRVQSRCSWSECISAIALICEIETWFIAHIWLFWHLVNQAVFSLRCSLFLYCQSMWQGGDGLLKCDPPPNVNSNSSMMKSVWVCVCGAVCVFVSDELVQYHSLSPAGKSLHCTSTLRVFVLLQSSVCNSTFQSLKPKCLEWIFGSAIKMIISKQILFNRLCASPARASRWRESGRRSGGSAASGLMGDLVKATRVQNKAIKMLQKRTVSQFSWNRNWIYLDWTTKAVKFGPQKRRGQIQEGSWTDVWFWVTSMWLHPPDPLQK